jgi:hypothetical protein
MPMDFSPSGRPRIIEIENPAGGHYQVGVEVDPKFAEVGTCPNLGTTIDSIIDSSFLDAKYAGMVFTESAKQKDGTFLLIFEKLPGPILSGQSRDRTLGVVIPWTEQRVAAGNGLGDASTEITPVNVSVSKSHVDDLAAYKAALLTKYFKTADLVDISLPDVLVDVEVIWGGSVGDGSSFSTPRAITDCNTGGGYTLHHSHESSSSVDGDVHLKMRRGFRGPAVATNHLFFLSDDAAEMSHVKAKIAAKLGVTVNDWPVVHEEIETLVLLSGSQQTRVAHSDSFIVCGGAPANVGGTQETSSSVGKNARVVTIPDCIHGQINIGEQRAGSFSDIGDTGLCYPTVLNPTTPPNLSAGVYLHSVSAAPFEAGTVRIVAKTVDLTNYV